MEGSLLLSLACDTSDSSRFAGTFPLKLYFIAIILEIRDFYETTGTYCLLFCVFLILSVSAGRMVDAISLYV